MPVGRSGPGRGMPRRDSAAALGAFIRGPRIPVPRPDRRAGGRPKRYDQRELLHLLRLMACREWSGNPPFLGLAIRPLCQISLFFGQ